MTRDEEPSWKRDVLGGTPRIFVLYRTNTQGYPAEHSFAFSSLADAQQFAENQLHEDLEWIPDADGWHWRTAEPYYGVGHHDSPYLAVIAKIPLNPATAEDF